jgi:hypothetical protein
MMTDEPLKPGDIALHSAGGAIWGALCGFGGYWGVIYIAGAPTHFAWWKGVALFLGSLVALGTGILLWLNREEYQHDYARGGRQSEWEWKAPAVVSVAAYVATVIVMNSI